MKWYATQKHLTYVAMSRFGFLPFLKTARGRNPANKAKVSLDVRAISKSLVPDTDHGLNFRYYDSNTVEWALRMGADSCWWEIERMRTDCCRARKQGFNIINRMLGLGWVSGLIKCLLKRNVHIHIHRRTRDLSIVFTRLRCPILVCGVPRTVFRGKRRTTKWPKSRFQCRYGSVEECLIWI